MRVDLTHNRNIYLNALHLDHDVLDLTEIFLDEFPNEFLEGIFKNGIHKSVFETSEVGAKKLNHFYFESKNLERIKGIKSLAIGFPMYIASDQEDFIVAPIFLKNIEIEKIQDAGNKWSIKNTANQGIRINPFLEKHFEKRFGDAYEEKFSELIKKATFDLSQLKSFSSKFSTNNQLEIPSMYNIFPNPGIDDLANISPRGCIKWSGVLGIFQPVFDQMLSSDEKGSVDAFFAETEIERENKHEFGLFENDPWQESAFQGALKNQNFLVTGSKGSGKSQIVLNTIVNGLSNGEKTMVVSNRVSVLHELQDELAKKLTAPLHFLMKNESMERSQFLALLKASAQSKRKPAFNQTDWNFKVKRTSREKNKLDKIYHAVNDPILGKYNWTDVVGLFLKNNSIEGKEKLNSQLKTQDFQYNSSEFDSIDFGISACQEPYQKINSLDHPLNVLHEKVFTTRSKVESLNHVKSLLEYLRAKADKLHKLYINSTDNYQSALHEKYDQSYRDISEKLVDIKEHLEDSENKYGKGFSVGFFEWIGFKGYFSKKNKEMYEGRKILMDKYEDLRLAFRQSKAFESNFADEIDTREVSFINEKLEKLENELESWRSSINEIVQEQMSKLTSRSVHHEMPKHQEKITKLEEKLDYFTNEINKASLFSNFYTNKMLTIPKRQQYLESVIEELERTEKNLEDFGDFYDWQSKWLALPKSGKKAVKALIKLKADDWGACFRSWYLHNFLKKYQQPELPQTDVALDDFVSEMKAVEMLIPNQIQTIWADKKDAAIAHIRRTNKNLYQFFDGKNNGLENQPIEETLANVLGEVTDLIPVVFCTPEVAFSFQSENEAPLFDRIIFEEANLLDFNQCIHLSKLGKQRLVVGDLGPISSDMESNFLDWTANQEIESIELRKRYSENISNLSDFNKVAFLPEGETSPDHKTEAKSDNFKVNAVKGRYSENEGTNEAEALHIIHLLNQIEQTPQRTYPSVGIGCFTHQQRDLLLKYLQEIKVKNAAGSEIIKHLERNGLGVFDISNMSAEQFDIVIVSSTFGALNTRGKLTEKIGQLDTEDGRKKIYTLVTSPRQQLHLVHSIPRKSLAEFQTDKTKEGLYRLSNLIKYGELIESGKKEEATKLLQNMYSYKPMEKHIPESIFNAEIAKRLKPYFEKGRVGLNLEWSKMNIPIYTTDKDGVLQTFLEADGFISHAPSTSYLWEQTQRSKIESGKMKFYPVWSLNWWKNPKDEARKLAGAIIKMDKQTIKKVKPVEKTEIKETTKEKLNA